MYFIQIKAAGYVCASGGFAYVVVASLINVSNKSRRIRANMFANSADPAYKFIRVQTNPGKPGKTAKSRKLRETQGKKFLFSRYSGKLREFFFKTQIETYWHNI